VPLRLVLQQQQIAQHLSREDVPACAAHAPTKAQSSHTPAQLPALHGIVMMVMLHAGVDGFG
jgi:hypothetical protein